MTSEWTRLLERYADGRPLCNCRQAYYSTDGEYIISGSGEVRHDGNYCKYGCQANIYAIREEIARRALAEIEHR